MSILTRIYAATLKRIKQAHALLPIPVSETQLAECCSFTILNAYATLP
jgi:hypothetical protein